MPPALPIQNEPPCCGSFNPPSPNGEERQGEQERRKETFMKMHRLGMYFMGDGEGMSPFLFIRRRKALRSFIVLSLFLAVKSDSWLKSVYLSMADRRARAEIR